jgi:hypothetical protein
MCCSPSAVAEHDLDIFCYFQSDDNHASGSETCLLLSFVLSSEMFFDQLHFYS